MTYLDQDTLDQCNAALRDGRTLEDIAGRLHVDTELLGRLLQLPVSQPAQPATGGDDFDLFACDRLDGQL
jgi:hypothetical protein